MQAERLRVEDEEVYLLGHHQDIRDSIINYAEPVSHIQNRKKGCKQFVCPCMDAPPDGCELTQEECNEFGKVKLQMNVPFEKTNMKHEETLKHLYDDFVVPAQPAAEDRTLKTKAWGVLGFQGDDPRTDFRGGGYTSLQLFLDFCRTHRDMLEEMKDHTARGLMLLACSSISTTFFIKNYFHMGELSVIPAHERPDKLASRTGFKSFCTWLTKDGAVLQRLHDLLLARLFQLWSEACKINPALTIMDLGSAEKLVWDDFKETSKSRHFDTLASFEDLILSRKLDPRRVKRFTY